MCAWLTSIGLPQYKESFEKNGINGAVLLEMQAEDLDFLSIRFPAHRRMLLRGISALSSSKSDDGDSAAGATETREPRSSSAKRIHWSVAAARAHEESVRSPKPTAPVSAACTADEIAQRRAFQEAVMAWRKSGQSESVTSITVGAATSSKGSEVSSTNSGSGQTRRCSWRDQGCGERRAGNGKRKARIAFEGEHDEIGATCISSRRNGGRRGGKSAPGRDVTEVTTKVWRCGDDPARTPPSRALARRGHAVAPDARAGNRANRCRSFVLQWTLVINLRWRVWSNGSRSSQ